MKLSDENPEDEITTLPLRLRCGWCKTILRDGIEPESTGICADCASKMRDAETVPNWKGSLGRLGKAQAILWNQTPLADRLRILAEVDAEPTQQADGFREVLNMRSSEQEQP